MPKYLEQRSRTMAHAPEAVVAVLAVREAALGNEHGGNKDGRGEGEGGNGGLTSAPARSRTMPVALGVARVSRTNSPHSGLLTRSSGSHRVVREAAVGNGAKWFAHGRPRRDEAWKFRACDRRAPPSQIPPATGQVRPGGGGAGRGRWR